MYLNNGEDEKVKLLENAPQDNNLKSINSPSLEISRSRASTVKIRENTRIPVPQFIEEQKKVYEKSKLFACLCYMCCLHKERDTIENMDANDLNAYYILKLIAKQPYNPSNPQHEDSLKFLYISCLQSDVTPSLLSSEWKKLGFQNTNPRLDFRAGGYFALLYIIYFVKQYEEDYKAMISYEFFLFALVGIKVAFLFILAFDCLEDEEECKKLRQLHKIQPVSVPMFKNFIRKQSQNESYVYELLARVMLNIKKEYCKAVVQKNVELNYLLLDPIILDCFKELYVELDIDNEVD